MKSLSCLCFLFLFSACQEECDELFYDLSEAIEECESQYSSQICEQDYQINDLKIRYTACVTNPDF